MTRPITWTFLFAQFLFIKLALIGTTGDALILNDRHWLGIMQNYRGQPRRYLHPIARYPLSFKEVYTWSLIKHVHWHCFTFYKVLFRTSAAEVEN
jgi:hypothetical protein